MSVRTNRLAAVIQRDLGTMLQQQYQPEGTFITVTRVRVTKDLSIAKVYLSVFSPGTDPDGIYQYIDDHTAEIRHELASLIRHQVRRIPELQFYVDDSAEYVNRMETLFKKVHQNDSGQDQDAS